MLKNSPQNNNLFLRRQNLACTFAYMNRIKPRSTFYLNLFLRRQNLACTCAYMNRIKPRSTYRRDHARINDTHSALKVLHGVVQKSYSVVLHTKLFLCCSTTGIYDCCLKTAYFNKGLASSWKNILYILNPGMSRTKEDAVVQRS